jgi:hypothetical protein
VFVQHAGDDRFGFAVHGGHEIAVPFDTPGGWVGRPLDPFQEFGGALGRLHGRKQ